jgi:hypothetical protein
MSMDWSNESYVRLYTRDTTNWKRLGWDGQSVLMALLRKVDRSGSLDLGGLEPWEAVSLHTGATEDIARRGVEALKRTETVTIRDDRLTFPSFIEAQECSKSDKQRAKESRERRAKGSDPSRPVTPESRDVTPPSQAVTGGHDASHAVTPRHSLLCSASPSSADPLQGNAVRTEIARAPEVQDSAEQKAEPRGPLAGIIAAILPAQGATQPPEPPPSSVPPAAKPASEPTASYPQDAPVLNLEHLVRQRFVAWFTQKRGQPPGQSAKQVEAYKLIADWLEGLDGDQPRMLEHLLQRFFCDEWAASKGFPVMALANDPPRYFSSPKAAGNEREEKLRALSKQLETLREQEAALGQNQQEDRAALIKRINGVKRQMADLKREAA